MNDILYLEPDDEITVVIDRMRASRTTGVVLVMPRDSALAQSIVNLKILKRNAEEQDKEIFLVTNDRITRNIASQVGIAVYAKASEAERVKPTIQPAKTASENEESESREADTEPSSLSSGGFRVNSYARFKVDAEDGETSKPEEAVGTVSEETEADLGEEDEPEVSYGTKKISVPVQTDEESLPGTRATQTFTPEEDESDFRASSINKTTNMATKKHIGGKKRLALTLFAITLIIALSFAYLLLPTASASLQLKTEDYTKELPVLVDRNVTAIDSTNVIIPGTLVEAEKEITKQFATTGTKNIGEKAKGKMNVYNGNDTSPHKYAKGTKFTSNGKIFVADAEFTVGAAVLSLSGGSVSVTPGEGSVAVTADQSGEAYNLASGTSYVIDGAPSKITAKGEAMAGGTTKELKMVAEQDLTDASAKVNAEIDESTKKEILDKAAALGLRLFDNGLVSEVVSQNSSKEADTEAENFDYTMKVKIFGLGFTEQDLRNVMIETIENEIKADKMLVNPDKSDLKFEVAESDRNMDKAKLKVNFTGKVAKKIDEASVKALMRNKSLGRVIEVLEQQDSVEKAEVSIWPTFIGRTPLIVNRLRVNYDYAQ